MASLIMSSDSQQVEGTGMGRWCAEGVGQHCKGLAFKDLTILVICALAIRAHPEPVGCLGRYKWCCVGGRIFTLYKTNCSSETRSIRLGSQKSLSHQMPLSFWPVWFLLIPNYPLSFASKVIILSKVDSGSINPIDPIFQWHLFLDL